MEVVFAANRSRAPMTFAVIKPWWHFPVVLRLGSWHVPIHPVCDVLAYTLGFQFYLYLRRRSPKTLRTPEQDAWILIGGIFGALMGSKVLAWMEAPKLYWALHDQPNFWFGGKTIVGGLLGGWAGIEIAKKATGASGSLGDVCVYPIILGMCIGRVGCFLTGLTDNTCGIPTSLPWGVDYGDGIPRHPAQVYEILFLITVGVILWIRRKGLAAPGLKFRWFIAAYLTFRLYIDFFKPHWTLFGGLSGIQWGCVLGLAICAYSLMKLTEINSTEHSHG
jgi:phosphatidylglycerol:prolipoprotein diacylglycerol transferase